MAVYAFKEPTWLDPNTERAMWSHLCRAYAVDFKLIDSFDELPENAALIISDEQGEVTLDDFEHPDDCVYLFGKTHQNNLLELPHETSVRITYPGNVTMFGITAAAIILSDRQGKLKWPSQSMQQT